VLSAVPKWMCIDLHVHTGASPCATKDMSPWNIVRMAQLENLSLIAITDHNTAANVATVMQVGDELGLVVLPGIEVQTREEVHLLAIFPTLEAVLAFEQFILQHLPNIANHPKVFGEQIIYDACDRQIGSIERLLLQSVMLGVEEVGEAITDYTGLTIAAHINRRSYSLIGQLGFVPGHFSVPILRNQSAPRRMMEGTLANVSTLLTQVGLPHNPTEAGYGGL
jgi:PHP family Zn ribbon phosphoesterase